MRSPVIVVATAIVAAVVGGAGLTACSASLPDTSPPATRPTGVPKAQLIEAGDAICADTDRRLAAIAEPATADDIEPFFRQSVAALRDEVRRIDALGTPDTDADKLALVLSKTTTAYDDLERRIPDLAKDPNLMNTDPQLQRELAEAGDAAAAFGFKTCGQTNAGADSSSTTAGSSPGSSAGSSPGTVTSTVLTGPTAASR